MADALDVVKYQRDAALAKLEAIRCGAVAGRSAYDNMVYDIWNEFLGVANNYPDRVFTDWEALLAYMRNGLDPEDVLGAWAVSRGYVRP